MPIARPFTRVVVSLIALILAPLSVSPTVGANGDTLAKVYWVDESFERTIQPVDPMSLADKGSPLSLALGNGVDTTFHLSGDGSTALLGHYTSEGSNWSLDLGVVDAVTGVERAAFPVDGRDAYVVALSRDGTRVVISTRTFDKRARLWASNWTVHETATGRPLSTFGFVHPDGEWFTPYVDERAEHMWLQSSTNMEPSFSYEAQMGSLVLRHVDLMSGLEVGRLTLGSVEVGMADRGEVVDQAPVFENVYPAIALAPDGRTLAILEASTEEVILLDGLTMARLDTFNVHEGATVGERLLRWAGLLPATAAAKLQVGEWRNVTFSADGGSLYLTGGRGEITGDSYEDYEAEWLGIRKIDIETGEVHAVALDGHQIDRVVPVASGDLYVLGPEVPWTEVQTQPSAMVLSRLDAETLEVEAGRELPTTVWQIIVVER